MNNISTTRFLFQMPKIFKIKCKNKIKLLLVQAKFFVDQKPRIRRAVRLLLWFSPLLKKRVMRVAMNASVIQRRRVPIPITLSRLSPRARFIYMELKAAIDSHNKDST